MIDSNLIFSNPLKYGNYKYIKSRYPKEYENIIKLEGRNFSEKLYKYLTGIVSGTCIICSKSTKFLDLKRGYAHYCSQKCACMDPKRQEKISNTMISRYGVTNISYIIKHKPRRPDITEKIADTKQERYGDPNYNNRAKASDTKQERYGDPNYNNRKKANLTTEMRYGVDNAFKLPWVFDKSLKARKNNNAYIRVGEHNMDRAIIRHDDVIDCKNGIFTCSCPHPNCSKCKEQRYDIAIGNYHGRKKYNVEPCTKLLPIQPAYSTLELQIREFLNQYNISYKTNVRDIINGELDIYIPSHKLAIECNGIYWHCDVYKDKNYHINKYHACLSHGIQLLTIWEDQWVNYSERIKNLIRSKLGIFEHRIFGRKCEVKEISKSEANKILVHHLQGPGQASIKLGLYYNNELLSVMTFGKKRIIMGGGNQDYELIRYCVKPGYQIIGGAGKLLTYFISHYNPSKIVSFSSNDISIGALYKTLKFEKISESESYWYIDKNMKRYHRYNFRKSRLIEDGYDENLTEKQITKMIGLYKIYDTGQTKWEWKV